MTELLLPGAGIPAAPEVSRPVRSLSAKSGSTSFSSILHRAAQSLRQSGATDPSYHSSSLLSSSLPFGTVSSAVTAENVSIPAISISQAESALLLRDTTRVVSEPAIQAETFGEVIALDANSEIAVPTLSDPETGSESMLQQMQDVLHTLAGVVTTLLRQNSEQGQSIDVVAAAAADNGISAAIPEITDEPAHNTAPDIKNILSPVLKTEENIPSERVADTDKPVISAPPVFDAGVYVAKDESTLVIPDTPTTNEPVVPTESTSENVYLGVVEPDQMDNIQVFVPSVGVVTIQPQPAEDGTVHLNVDIPREIPRTPAVLHNLLRDVVDEVQQLLATNGNTDTNIFASPIVPDKGMESSSTSIPQAGENTGAVAESNGNTVILKGDAGTTPEKIVQEGTQRSNIAENNVSYKNVIASAPVVDNNAELSMPKENKTIAANASGRDMEFSDVILPTVTPQAISSGEKMPVSSPDYTSITVPVAEVPQNNVSPQAKLESASPALPVGVIHFTFTATPNQKVEAPTVQVTRDVHIPVMEGSTPAKKEKTTDSTTELPAGNSFFIPKEFTKPATSADVDSIRQSYTTTTESGPSDTSLESIELAVPVGKPVDEVRLTTTPASNIYTAEPERVDDSSKADISVHNAGTAEPVASQYFIDNLQAVLVETSSPVVATAIPDTIVQPVLPSSVGALRAEVAPISGADHGPTVSPIAQDDISESFVSSPLKSAPMEVVSNPVDATDLSQPKQANTNDGIQSFFPYMKPTEEPQKEDGGEQIEEPELPATLEPAQVVTSANAELGDIPVTDTHTTQVSSVNTAPSYEATSILSTTITEKTALAEEQTVISGEPAKVDTFASVTNNNRKSVVSETPIADTVLWHPEEQQESSVISVPQNELQMSSPATRVAGSNPEIEPKNEQEHNDSIRGKNSIAVEHSPSLQRPDRESDFDEPMPTLESGIEPLPVQVQTDRDMIGLDTLLREVQRHGATVTRLSITMPQQVVDMNNHSPKANNNQTTNIVRDTILTENTDVPLTFPAPVVSESTNILPRDGVEVQSREDVELSPVNVPVSELIGASESKIGTSIEGLYRRPQDNGDVPAPTPLGVGQPDEQALDLSGQPMVRETATIDSSFQSMPQPVASVDSAPRLYPDNVQVARDTKKTHDAGMTEPVISTANVREYSAPRLQETKPVTEQPSSPMTSGRADTQQIVASGNSENATLRPVPIDGNSASVVNNMSVPEQNNIAGAVEAVSYQVAARSSSPVRTTAGRLSAARNAVESLREHGTSTFSSSAGKEPVDIPIFEPLLRSNSEGQENAQTPFRHETQNQNNDMLFAQNERSIPAGSEGYQKVANSPAEPTAKATEEVHSKNPVWPEIIHPGVQLPVMPKVTPPVVRTYRHVVQQEIPQVVQTAVRTFPAGAGGAIQMMLAPESLGEVLVSISVRESVAEVRIDTETQESRRIVEAQLPALRDKLAQSGLQVEYIEVRTKQQDTVQSDASRSGRQGNQTQEEQKSRQDFVRSFRHLAGDESREQPDTDTKRLHLYRMRGGNFERYA